MGKYEFVTSFISYLVSKIAPLGLSSIHSDFQCGCKCGKPNAYLPVKYLSYKLPLPAYIINTFYILSLNAAVNPRH